MNNVNGRMRIKAVFCCLYFGLLPSWVYETRCHYSSAAISGGMTYWEHLKINLRRARLWAWGLPDQHEVDFELRVNRRPNWLRWQERTSI